MTQPALSMQIRDLEKDLGIDLVERRPGEVILTDVGGEVVRRAERVIAAARDLTEFARQVRGGQRFLEGTPPDPTRHPVFLIEAR